MGNMVRCFSLALVISFILIELGRVVWALFRGWLSTIKTTEQVTKLDKGFFKNLDNWLSEVEERFLT